MVDLVKLREELAKPEYAALDDVAAAKKINQQDRQVNRDSIDSGSLVVSVAPAEYAALPPADKDYLTFITRAPSFPLDKQIRDYLNDVFPAGSVTRGRLRAVLKRVGSRAEELTLWRVTESDVADARRLT